MRFFALIACFLAAAPAYGVEITGLRIELEQGYEHVSLRLSGRPDYKVFNVQALPPRIAVDLKNTQPRGVLAMPQDYRGTMIHSVRFGFHNEMTGRVVFDLTADAQPRDIKLVGSEGAGGYWLEFDVPQSRSAPAENIEQQKPPEQAQFSPPPSRRHETPVKPKHEAKPMIIIDAGHGGQDPGTSGRGGTDEKDLTLRYALALKESLTRTGYFHVTLTRSDDRYLLLRERVRRARAAHGDLFISLHADSAPTRFARAFQCIRSPKKPRTRNRKRWQRRKTKPMSSAAWIFRAQAKTWRASLSILPNARRVANRGICGPCDQISRPCRGIAEQYPSLRRFRRAESS